MNFQYTSLGGEFLEESNNKIAYARAIYLYMPHNGTIASQCLSLSPMCDMQAAISRYTETSYEGTLSAGLSACFILSVVKSRLN